MNEINLEMQNFLPLHVFLFGCFCLCLSASYSCWRNLDLSRIGFTILEFRLRFDYQLAKLVEKLQMQIASMLPRWLVYSATVRLFSAATTGKYGSTEASEVRAITCLKRWKK